MNNANFLPLLGSSAGQHPIKRRPIGGTALSLTLLLTCNVVAVVACATPARPPTGLVESAEAVGVRAGAPPVNPPVVAEVVPKKRVGAPSDPHGTPGAAPDASQPLPNASPAEHPPRIVISELLSDAFLVDDPAGEFIEIVNLSTDELRLVDLSLELPSGQRVHPKRDAQPTLRACGVLVMTPLGSGDDEASVKRMRLPNRAGRVVLRWREHVVDTAIWTGKRPWPKHRPGYAIERTSVAADGVSGRSWRHSVTPLRGEERGSPGVSSLACAADDPGRSAKAPAQAAQAAQAAR